MSLPLSLIAPKVEEFVNNLLPLTYYFGSRGKYSYLYYEEMCRNSIKLSMAMEIRLLETITAMGEYDHPDKAIAKDVNDQLQNIRGSTRELFLNLLSFIPYGFCVAEKRYEVIGKAARLAELFIVNHRYIGFDIEYQQLVGFSLPGMPGILTRDRCLLLTNRDYMTLGCQPWGIPCLGAAAPYYEMHKILLGYLSIAAQRQATPILVGKTSSGAETSVLTDSNGFPLIDGSGNPIMATAAQAMLNQLEAVGNSSAIVIDRMDELISVSQQTDGEFFSKVLYYLDSMMCWAFGVSPILLGTSESGVGDSNLAQTHKEVLQELCYSQANIIGETIIQEAIRPMLEFNNGRLDKYGSFPKSLKPPILTGGVNNATTPNPNPNPPK